MKILSTYQNFYFVGIGGIGMSALARYFHASGKNVLGYDKTQTKLTNTLESEGISILFNDEITEEIVTLNTEDTLVVYTPAIKELNILHYFQEKKFNILKRAKVLGLITENTECLAVAGTHGKTTTSTLLAHLCKEANLPFSCFLGGISENFGSNFYFNGNKISVVEADEYDRSFLSLSPDYAIITSTDADHLDIYGDEATIQEGFNEFANLITSPKQLFIKKGVNIVKDAITYSVNEKADYFADHLRLNGDQMLFNFHTPTDSINDISWEIPGIHNVENAVASLALLHSKGVDLNTLKTGLKTFKGIKRRYTKHQFNSGKIYIDDYAHHPTELNAVLGSIRTFHPDKEILVVFQPHLFSRTRDFVKDFAKSLSMADQLILLDIYPARELQKDFIGINSNFLLEKIDLEKKEVATLEESLNRIKTKKFDIILTVGAGNIDTLYEPIINWLEKL